MTVLRTFCLGVAASLLLSGSGVAAEPDPDLVRAERTLKDADVGLDGPSLLAFFRARTLSPEEQARLGKAVRLLGDDSFEVREKATADLLKAGRTALPFLRNAVADPDVEIVRRVQACLDDIELSRTAPLVMAAARVLGERKPVEAAEVILAYLPFSDEEMVDEALIAALRVVAVQDGKPATALLAALKDKIPVRRAAAAQILGRLLKPEERQPVVRLLEDQEPRVRFEAAVALTSAGERLAVPVLLTLLSDGPAALAWQSEELLYRLAADAAPNTSLGAATQEERQKCREDWEKWWKTQGAKVDLTRLEQAEPYRGLTIVCEYDGSAGGGRVCELGKDGKVHWEVGGLQGPNDVQLLPGGRILVAERNGGQVCERDRQGRILWKYAAVSPIACQRLPGGNTLIATFNDLLEVTPEGKTVHSLKHRSGFRHALRLRNGHVVFVASNGEIGELDAKWDTVRTITPKEWGNGAGYWASIEPLPGGRYLVVYGGSSKIVEVDAKGAIVWQCNQASPVFATRLRNGNTLIACFENKSVVEVDRDGKEVGKLTLQGRPFTVRRY
jgi:HEAT repeat protein